MSGIVDFHSHLLPAVDDGARHLTHSIDSLKAFAAQGVTTCVTTPHFDASLTRVPERLAARLAEFDRAWEALLAEVAMSEGATTKEPQLPALARGTEVMLDEPDPDLSDSRIRLNGGAFVLCEFPMLQLPPNAQYAIENLIRRGWRPIVAHPERYRNLDSRFSGLARLREAGALFQMNAGSLLGMHGDAPERVARQLLGLGWIDYLSSDHHARGAPATARALEVLCEHGGEAQAARLSVENPQRMLVGEPPLAVEAFAPPDTSSWWQRLLRRRSGS
jgi:protein-tyrosine phosphatase